MRAVFLDVPQEILEQRRKTGADRRDEVWDGVLHMVPAPSTRHQRFNGDLYTILRPHALAKGLEPFWETDLHRPGADGKDYRQPDIMFVRPELVAEVGVVGPAELLVEILSPSDESTEKLPFYERLRCREALYVDPKTCSFTLFALAGKKLRPVRPTRDGFVVSKTLGVRLRSTKGPKLEVVWRGGSETIEPFVPRGRRRR